MEIGRCTGDDGVLETQWRKDLRRIKWPRLSNAAASWVSREQRTEEQHGWDPDRSGFSENSGERLETVSMHHYFEGFCFKGEQRKQSCSRKHRGALSQDAKELLREGGSLNTYQTEARWQTDCHHWVPPNIQARPDPNLRQVFPESQWRGDPVHVISWGRHNLDAKTWQGHKEGKIIGQSHT